MKKTLTLLALLTCFVSTECLARAADDAAGLSISEKMRSQLKNSRNCIKYTPEQAAAVASDEGNTFSVTYSGSKVRRGGNTNADCSVVENVTSAESMIRDTDMATEMVEYSKNNILAQAGQSMLDQANQSNEGVLNLLQ